MTYSQIISQQHEKETYHTYTNITNQDSQTQFENRIKPRVYLVLCIKKLHFVSQNWRKEISYVTRGAALLKSTFLITRKSLISRINEVDEFFNKISL